MLFLHSQYPFPPFAFVFFHPSLHTPDFPQTSTSNFPFFCVSTKALGQSTHSATFSQNPEKHLGGPPNLSHSN